MPFGEMCRKLTQEPYNLTFDQIAKLTDYQLMNVLSEPKPKTTPPELRQSSKGFRQDFIEMTMETQEISREQAEEFFAKEFPSWEVSDDG